MSTSTEQLSDSELAASIRERQAELRELSALIVNLNDEIAERQIKRRAASNRVTEAVSELYDLVHVPIQMAGWP